MPASRCVTTNDPDARVQLVDALARDGMAAVVVLDGQELSEALSQAAALLVTVLGQDLDQDEAGVFRIARRVAKDRAISTVDPETRQAQDRGTWLRRLQGPHRYRPRHRDHHRDHGHGR